MDYQTIVYSTDGTVATISLNRPERLNTIVPPMPEEIANAIDYPPMVNGTLVKI